MATVSTVAASDRETERESAGALKMRGYCSRWDLILERCRSRSVFHLGCVGETDGSIESKVNAFQTGLALHPHLTRVASEVIGLDLNAKAVNMLRQELGCEDLLIGDVEHLEQLPLKRTFAVIVFGDLIEHLSCPGLALEGIRRFMSDDSELIISTPNAFSLLANVRFTLGRFRDGAEHVAHYSKFALSTLLERHHLETTEFFTCFDRPPQSWLQRFRFALGTPVFKIAPERGGTLLCIARRAR